MCFLPQHEQAREFIAGQFEKFIAKEGQRLIGWRDVPIDHDGPRQGGARLDAGDPPVLRRARRQLRRPGRVRAQADRDPQADPEPARRARRRSTACPRSPSSTCRASRAARWSTRGCCWRNQVGSFYDDLRDPDCASRRSASSTSASDQHLPQLEARAPLPVHRPQRRDQHRARQRQLDERAPADDGIAAARRRPRQAVADHPARPVGHRLPRQRARAAAARRLLAGARDDDADPGGLGRQPADGCRAPRVLRIPRRADGAVGRPGRGRLHRRPPDRRHARPQRPAARRASASPTTTSSVWPRKAACCRSRGGHRPQVAPAARQDAADRPRAGPHRRGRGDQGRSSPRPSPTRSGSSRRSTSSRTSRRSRPTAPRCASETTTPARSPAGVRLHPGGRHKFLEPMARSRRRSDRLDGHRHADRGARRPSRGCSTTTSSRTSPRSPTRRSTRSARSW